ncbi:MAG: hypothetical protein LBV74_20555 [Tannerella sp.]|jgi:hypothetical protein|nr:hypothetical protein [Tannerella sp.]
MKIKYLFISLTFVFLIACSQKIKKAEIQNVPEILEDWHSFDNDFFSIRYPRNWEKQRGPEGTVFCILSTPSSPVDTFRENVNLVIEELTKEITLDRYAALSLKNIGNKYKVTDERKYAANGQEYYYLKLKERDGIFLEQNYFIKGKRAYILTFTYEPQEQESVKTDGDKIMKSFRLK